MLSSSQLHRGAVTTNLIGNPAPGANFHWAVPALYNIEVHYISLTLTNDANAANRNLTLQFREPGGAVMWRSSPIFVQLATIVRTYYASQSNAPITIVYPNALQLALPPQNLLRYGWFIDSEIGSIQAGDQLSEIRITYIRQANST